MEPCAGTESEVRGWGGVTGVGDGGRGFNGAGDEDKFRKKESYVGRH